MAAYAAQSSKINNRYHVQIFLYCNRDSGVKAIENLVQKQGSIDYILLETTGIMKLNMWEDSYLYYLGLADPGPIIEMFWLDDMLESQVGLDAVITLVDAKHGLEVSDLLL
jgi:G3E family GTPase